MNKIIVPLFLFLMTQNTLIKSQSTKANHTIVTQQLIMLFLDPASLLKAINSSAQQVAEQHGKELPAHAAEITIAHAYLREQLANAYQGSFTNEELQTLLLFFNSAVGEKFLSLLGDLSKGNRAMNEMIFNSILLNYVPEALPQDA